MNKFFRGISVIGLVVGGHAAHGDVIDQSFLPGPYSINASVGELPEFDYGFQVFQSFTADEDGLLTGLEIIIDKWGDPTEGLTFDIVSGTDPNGDALATAFLDPSAAPLSTPEDSMNFDWVFVDFSAAGFVVEAGDFLGYRISSDQDFSGNENEYRIYGNPDGGYPAGSGAQILTGDAVVNGELLPAGTLLPNPGWDFYFRTYSCEPFPGGGVTGGCKPPPNPVPEPTTLMLLGAGLLGMSATRRRKKA